MDETNDRMTFAEWLGAVIPDTLYLGSSVDDLQDEIYNNHWRLYGSPDQTAQYDFDQMRQWLIDVLVNREQQLLGESSGRRAIFYMWVDSMLAQLRLNVISDFHDSLPFGCKVNILQTPDQILLDFLARTSREEPWLNTDPDDRDEFLTNHGLNVYAVALPRSIWHISDWIEVRD